MSESFFKKPPSTHSALASVGALSYTAPPHMDAKALIVRAAAKLRAWHEKYGEHQPQWLPPAGDVEWLEDAAAYIAAHTLPAPDFCHGHCTWLDHHPDCPRAAGVPEVGEPCRYPDCGCTPPAWGGLPLCRGATAALGVQACSQCHGDGYVIGPREADEPVRCMKCNPPPAVTAERMREAIRRSTSGVRGTFNDQQEKT